MKGITAPREFKKFGRYSHTHGVTLGGGPVQGQELDSMIPVGPFSFDHSVIQGSPNFKEALASQNQVIIDWLCIKNINLFKNINHGEDWVIPVLWKALLSTCPTLPCPAATLQPLMTPLLPIFVSTLTGDTGLHPMLGV